MSSKTALEQLRGTKLSTDTKYDLYEQYLEDEDRFSAATALEKLDTAIRDLTEEPHAANT